MDLPRHYRLHLLALAGFAIAQPLYDLIGRHAQFLVAHRASPWTIVALMAALSFGVPLVLIAAVDLTRAGSRWLAAWVQRAFVGMLAALIAANIARTLPPAAALALAAAAAAAAMLAYRAPAVRTFLTILSPAAIVFPIIFATATPVARLLWTHAGGQETGSFTHRPPIVFVVFDEMSTFTLLGPDGRIDPERFPSIAALSNTATWFPNAVSAFPYTMFAFPALVSGTAPDPTRELLPIASDYPNTLFTWLGESYDLHVSEPITALCPQAHCGAAAAANRRVLASDLGVLYLHLIVPADLAATRLPSLNFSWKGFDAGPAPAISPEARAEWRADTPFNKAAEAGRAQAFEAFIAGITRTERPALYFVHSLLPHDPYEYLADGSVYTSPALTDGMSHDNVWSTDGWIVDAGRERHIEQERFADALLGELVEKLKQQDLFDRALVIVTSDHGGAFVPGQPHRHVTASTYQEVIATPLLIKLPRQRTGDIDPRRVSGLDILPTIAQVLGAPLPWEVSGASVFSPRFPQRPTIQYAGVSLPPLQAFDVRRVAERIRAEHGLKDPYARLIGQRSSSLDLGPPIRSIRVFSDAFRAFGSVDPTSGFVPALVRGRLGVDGDTGDPVTLALVVNGTVAAFVRTLDWQGVSHYFAALLPEGSLRAGANTLEILHADARGGRLRLAPIATDLSAGVSLDSTGATLRIQTGSGQRIAISDEVTGFVERVDDHGKSLVVHGWVASRSSGRPVPSVVAFAGDTLIGAAAPAGERPDAARALGLPAHAVVSYSVQLAAGDLERGPLRLFALSDSAAGELRFTPAILNQLARYR